MLVSNILDDKRFFVIQGQVIESFPETRTIRAKWLAGNQPINDVRVITSPGDLAFPSKGEYCLIIGDDSNYFYIGKMDLQFSEKVTGKGFNTEGEEVDTEIKNEQGAILVAPKVNEGEAVIANQAKGLFLKLLNNENFSLVNVFQDGLKFIKKSGMFPVRWLQLLGQTVSMIGNAQKLNIGTMIREVVTMGNVSITSPFTALNAVEFLVELVDLVTSSTVAKFQLGDIFESPIVPSPLPVGIPEVSTTTVVPAPLRGVLEIYGDTGTSMSSVKMDKLGHTYMYSAVSTFMEAGATFSLDAPYISLGANAAMGTPAIEPVIKGITHDALESAYLTAEFTYLGTEATWLGVEFPMLAALAAYGTANAAALTALLALPTAPGIIAYCTTMLPFTTTLGLTALAASIAQPLYTTSNGIYTTANQTFKNTIGTELSKKVFTV